jgi:hypothetical protein
VLERALPKDNLVRRNVSWGEHFLVVGPQASLDHVRVEQNLIADPIVFSGSPTGDGASKTYRKDDQTIRTLLEATGNVFVDGDPGFADIEAEDFRLPPDSPAWALGFAEIPFERIGLRTDEFRTSLPPRTPAIRLGDGHAVRAEARLE